MSVLLQVNVIFNMYLNRINNYKSLVISVFLLVVVMLSLFLEVPLKISLIYIITCSCAMYFISINPVIPKINRKTDFIKLSLEQLNNIFYIFPMSTMILNKDLKIINFNQRVKKYLQENEIPTLKNIENVLDRGSFQNFLEALNSKKEPFPVLEVKIRDTNLISLLYVTKMKLNKDVVFVLNFIDISKQKMLENDFVHLQKLQVLGTFLSSIVHDFNNLLTAIIGFSDILLSRHSSGSESFNEITQIKQNAIRSSNLVKQILSFSRKEFSKPTMINVSNCITDLYQLIKKLIGENVNFSIEHKGEPCYINIDKSQLEQIIVNLSVNAKESLKDKDGFFKIITEYISLKADNEYNNLYSPYENYKKIPEGKYSLITLEDNGHGIDDNILQKIFDPFFSTKSSKGGTGLGLSTIYNIITSANGYIKIDTKKNYGTRFYIFFKPSSKILSETVDNKMIQEYKNINHERMVQNKKTKILIVEDENPVRMVTIHALKENGYQVLESHNGTEALEILQKNDDIDLLITDLMMTKMDGTELIVKVRQIFPKLKIIVTSGYVENAMSYIDQYACIFLNKPYTLKKLTDTVQKTLIS